MSSKQCLKELGFLCMMRKLRQARPLSEDIQEASYRKETDLFWEDQQKLGEKKMPKNCTGCPQESSGEILGISELTQNLSHGQETELYDFETSLSIENSYRLWNKSSHLWLSEKFKCWQYQLVGLQIRKTNTLSWDWAKVNVLQYIRNCLDTQRGWKKRRGVLLKTKQNPEALRVYVYLSCCK